MFRTLLPGAGIAELRQVCELKGLKRAEAAALLGAAAAKGLGGGGSGGGGGGGGGGNASSRSATGITLPSLRLGGGLAGLSDSIGSGLCEGLGDLRLGLSDKNISLPSLNLKNAFGGSSGGGGGMGGGFAGLGIGGGGGGGDGMDTSKLAPGELPGGGESECVGPRYFARALALHIFCSPPPPLHHPTLTHPPAVSAMGRFVRGAADGAMSSLQETVRSTTAGAGGGCAQPAEGAATPSAAGAAASSSAAQSRFTGVKNLFS